MPRLRRIKNYDAITQPESEATDADLTGIDRGECDYNAPQSWWSDLSIISTMPDQKLREARDYHKRLYELCNSEITRRRVSGISIRATQTFDVGLGSYRYVPVERTYKYTKRSQSGKTTERKHKHKQQIKLTPAEISQALQMLMKLKSNKEGTKQ